MPASISESEISVVKAFLKEKKLKHLRCRQRAAAVIVESGPQDDALGHLRLRKLSATNWAADEFHHSGRWAPLLFRRRSPTRFGRSLPTSHGCSTPDQRTDF